VLLYLKIKEQIIGEVIDMSQKTIPAVAYLRTSSASNVGADKDSDKRQRAAIQGFAKAAGYEIVAELRQARDKWQEQAERATLVLAAPGRPWWKRLAG